MNPNKLDDQNNTRKAKSMVLKLMALSFLSTAAAVVLKPMGLITWTQFWAMLLAPMWVPFAAIGVGIVFMLMIPFLGPVIRLFRSSPPPPENNL